MRLTWQSRSIWVTLTRSICNCAEPELIVREEAQDQVKAGPGPGRGEEAGHVGRRSAAARGERAVGFPAADPGGRRGRPRASCCSGTSPRSAWSCAGSCPGCCGRGSTRSTSSRASGGASSGGCADGPAEFEDSRHLVAFLARAAKNKVIDEYRRAASRKQDMHREEPLWGDGGRPRSSPTRLDTPSEVAAGPRGLRPAPRPAARGAAGDPRAEGRRALEQGHRRAAGDQRADRPARPRGPAAPGGVGVGARG